MGCSRFGLRRFLSRKPFRRLLLSGFILVMGAGLVYARAPLSARQVFLRLPTSIFDNTGNSLSESDKFTLVTRGTAGGWVIRTSSPDLLELESILSGSKVSLCLFRGQRRTVAALGTEIGPVCLTELWRYGESGAVSPLSVPNEDYVLDFFAPGKRIPADITVSTTYCVHPQGLEVRPQFWSPIGEAKIQPDNAVFYIWTGRRFSKRIVPINQGE